MFEDKRTLGVKAIWASSETETFAMYMFAVPGEAASPPTALERWTLKILFWADYKSMT